VHDSVFPDEAICDHLVRFELKPFRRIKLPSGGSSLMGASALNQHLGLSGSDEWPALVAPDLIEVVITVVDEVTARRLYRYEDWIIDWDRVESPAAQAVAATQDGQVLSRVAGVITWVTLAATVSPTGAL
jgi:hypothetical protein